jgi:hypothetical protein
MADYTDSKLGLGSVLPNNMTENGTWSYLEPLIEPDRLIRLFLLGIPLVIKDSFTGKPIPLGPEVIKEQIIEAVGLTETETGADIIPKQITEKQAFDFMAYRSCGYMMLRHRPVISIESFTLTDSMNRQIFKIENDWIETSQLQQGQLNILPLGMAANGQALAPFFGGASLMYAAIRSNWIPSVFQVQYTAGFRNAMIPKPLNQLIGTIAAMEVLSIMAATFARSTSGALSIDGLSQSASSPGGDLYSIRLKDLAEKRNMLVKKIQRKINLGLIIDNV